MAPLVRIAARRADDIVVAAFEAHQSELFSEACDPATGTWSPAGAIAGPRARCVAPTIPDRVLAIGGETTGAAPVATFDVFIAAAGPPAPQPTVAGP